MLLILCNHEDYVANALFLHLQQRKINARIVTADELVFAKSWVHQCDKDGIFKTEIILPDGFTIASEKITRIFNRIRFFPTTHFSSREDFAYSQMEFHALYASFLLSMQDKLFEKISTHHLSLTEYETYCAKMAIDAGLPVLDRYFSSAKETSIPGTVLFAAQQSMQGIKYKKWVYPVAPDAPRLYRPATKGEFCKAIVAGNQAIIPKEINRWSKAIRLFAKKTSRSFFELHFGKTTGGFKLVKVDIFPEWTPESIIHIIADQLTGVVKK